MAVLFLESELNSYKTFIDKSVDLNKREKLCVVSLPRCCCNQGEYREAHLGKPSLKKNILLLTLTPPLKTLTKENGYYNTT